MTEDVKDEELKVNEQQDGSVTIGDEPPPQEEDSQEDERVVDAEGLLDQVAGEPLEAGLRAAPPEDPAVEREGERDPDDAPDRRLPHRDLVGLAVEDEEIEGEHPEDEAPEEEPEREIGRHERETSKAGLDSLRSSPADRSAGGGGSVADRIDADT